MRRPKQICLHDLSEGVALRSKPLQIYCSMRKENIKIAVGLQSRWIPEEWVDVCTSGPEEPRMSCGSHICTNHFHIFVSPCNLFLQRSVIMSARTLASPSMPVASETASSSAAPSPWSARTVSSKPKEARPSPVS